MYGSAHSFHTAFCYLWWSRSITSGELHKLELLCEVAMVFNCGLAGWLADWLAGWVFQSHMYSHEPPVAADATLAACVWIFCNHEFVASSLSLSLSLRNSLSPCLSFCSRAHTQTLTGSKCFGSVPYTQGHFCLTWGRAGCYHTLLMSLSLSMCLLPHPCVCRETDSYETTSMLLQRFGNSVLNKVCNHSFTLPFLM